MLQTAISTVQLTDHRFLRESSIVYRIFRMSTRQMPVWDFPAKLVDQRFKSNNILVVRYSESQIQIKQTKYYNGSTRKIVFYIGAHSVQHMNISINEI